MKYNDEERIRRKNAISNEVEETEQEIGSIYEGTVNIHNVECKFIEKKLEEFPCYIYMPEQFRLFTDQEKEIMFARTKPPKLAYGSDDLLLFLSASVTESPLKNEQINSFLVASETPLQALIPQSKVYKTYIEKKGEKNVGYIEFVSGGIGGKIYNLMMFISIEEKLFIINIYTLNELKKRVFPYMEQMAKSLRIEEAENASDNT